MSSVGSTAFAPYTMEKRLWPVARFSVLLRDQRTTGSSSIQRLPHFCNLSKVLVLSLRNTSAFIFSTCPLLRGWATEAKETLLPRLWMYCIKVRLVNWVPLSVNTLLGTPKRHTNPFKNLTTYCAVTFLTGSTSGHFVNLSVCYVQEFKAPSIMGEGGHDIEPPDREWPG